jgi:adenosine deaminase
MNRIHWFVPALLCCCGQFLAGASPSTLSVEARFNEIRKSPPELYAFLLRMPKGGDLHNHLAGAVYAETFVHEAAAKGLCVERSTHVFLQQSAPCQTGQIDSSEAERDGDVASSLIDSLSMRDFVPGQQSAHDHFFDTFGKFDVVSHGNDSEYVVEAVRRAAEQNESYLELMALGAGVAVSRLGSETGLDSDFDMTRQRLLQGGLEKLVADLRQRIHAMEQGRVKELGCDTQPDSTPCKVGVKYILQVLRLSPKEQVFAQTMAGFMLADSDPRVVAVNFVQPEDGLTSMKDYHLHMQMVAYARRIFPKVHVALHAGELASGLVPPEGLRFHIQEAVDLARAERIGHGVDIMYETKSYETMRTMRERHIPVEVNLTSNDIILGVKGNDHPFPVYRKYGVPVVLSTDDEGVSRTHLTQEYQRAVLAYGLTYSELKQIARNSLQYSFLPGAGFWRDELYRAPVAACAGGRGAAACRTYLEKNEKARLQADLETRFDVFEKSVRQWPPVAK